MRRVQIAIQMLNSLNKPVTSRNLSEVMGASCENLKRYPRAKALLEKAMEDRLQQRAQKKQQRGEELAGQVQTAIQELVALGIPVTQVAISQKVGLSLCALKQYPLVKKIIAPIGEHNRHKRKEAFKNVTDVSQDTFRFSLTKLFKRISSSGLRSGIIDERCCFCFSHNFSMLYLACCFLQTTPEDCFSRITFRFSGHHAVNCRILRASCHFGDKVCNNKIGKSSVQFREPIAKKSNLARSSSFTKVAGSPLHSKFTGMEF